VFQLGVNLVEMFLSLPDVQLISWLIKTKTKKQFCFIFILFVIYLLGGE